MEQQTQPQVRVHISEPGPRSGVPYSISIETINARELGPDALEDEVTNALKVYDATKQEMEARYAPKDKVGTALLEQLRASAQAVQDARSGA